MQAQKRGAKRCGGDSDDAASDDDEFFDRTKVAKAASKCVRMLL